jgi:Methyltransferase domain
MRTQRQHSNPPAANSRPRVMAIMPTRGYARAEATYSHAHFITAGGCEIIPGLSIGSLLGHTFNFAWTQALMHAHAGNVTHFLLHHDDIEVQTAAFADVMLKEMERTGAAVLSAVVTLKSPERETSTAIDSGDPWHPRRLTLEETWRLPETFCTADLNVGPCDKLLVNSGLMLVDLRRPEFFLVRDGELVFFFDVNDRIRVEEGFILKPEFKSEDWNFSRLCHAHGLPVYATRKVVAVHHGEGRWSNEAPAGTIAGTNAVPQPADDETLPWTSPRRCGWFDYADVYRLAVQYAPERGRLVEIGCWRGKSLSFLLAEAERSGKELLITGVDHFQGSVNQPWLQDEAMRCNLEAECRANCEKVGYPFKLLRRHSVAAAAEFADGSCDFIFIDASHDYESVAADIRAWRPKLKPGGIMAGHDFDEPGVAQAVAELCPEAGITGNCWILPFGKAAEA